MFVSRVSFARVKTNIGALTPLFAQEKVAFRDVCDRFIKDHAVDKTISTSSIEVKPEYVTLFGGKTVSLLNAMTKLYSIYEEDIVQNHKASSKPVAIVEKYIAQNKDLTLKLKEANAKARKVESLNKKIETLTKKLAESKTPKVKTPRAVHPNSGVLQSVNVTQPLADLLGLPSTTVATRGEVISLFSKYLRENYTKNEEGFIVPNDDLKAVFGKDIAPFKPGSGSMKIIASQILKKEKVAAATQA